MALHACTEPMTKVKIFSLAGRGCSTAELPYRGEFILVYGNCCYAVPFVRKR